MTDANQDLLDAAPCGIFSFTEEGVITMANAYCHKVLEYENEELIGTNIAALLTISGRIFYQTHFYPLVKMHHHFEEFFLNLQSKSQKDIPVAMNAVLNETDDGTVILCSFIPVFNRRKYEDEILVAKRVAEEAMQQNAALENIKRELEVQQIALDKQISLLKFQNKEILQLSDIITHDLQEPVRKLMLFSNELLNDNADIDLKRHSLTVIQRSSLKIKTLLQNLQSYLSLTAPDPEKENVNLADLLQYELKTLQDTYPEIKVAASIDPLPTMKGNSRQLSQLLHHLLKNAFDHASIDNHLYLEIHGVIVKENIFSSLEHKYKYVDYIRLTVKDKGAGFDNKYNDYIFNVLKKININNNSAGFGLAFCKRIAENHFGNIKAEGSDGKGAIFTIMLPIDNVS